MSLAMGSERQPRPAQNWIISRNWDLVLIIAAPVLAFIWVVGTLQLFEKPAVGHFVVLAIFTVFNVAHHFPTFIRIYGDRDLLKRFRWELIFGPIFPLSLAIVAVYMVIGRGIQEEQTAENIARSMIFLFLVLLIWDPWHFLMQHYGFMRIYDRHNQAPQKIAARMDLAVSWVWFLCILVLISDWLPGLLYNLQRGHSVSLVFWFHENTYLWLERSMVVLASGMGVVYLGYLIWCYQRGYYISWAKLLLLAVTFIVMYVTYVPNPLIARIVPDWNFSLGFATLGMVHVTQYLAIVWKYNRGLATKKRARTPGFSRVFAKVGIVGFMVLAAYVVSCLIYGVAISMYGVTLPFDSAELLFRFFSTSNLLGETVGQWLVSVARTVMITESSSAGLWYGGILAAIGFTSTFLHYYYDGFIWKIRHKENQQNLALNETDGGKKATGNSWWSKSGRRSPVAVLLRQSLYLGLPVLAVIVTYMVTIDRNEPYMEKEGRVVTPKQVYNLALALKDQDADQAQMAHAAEFALDQFQGDLELEQKMIQIRPTAMHYAMAAELTYHIAVLKRECLSEHPEHQQTTSQYQQALCASIFTLEEAFKLKSPYGFPAGELKKSEARVKKLRDECYDRLSDVCQLHP